MADVAYKPIGTTNPKDADISKLNQIPPYDDPGISFKGYSKTKQTDGSYQLNVQERYSYISSTGVINGFNYNNSIGAPPIGKSFYIQSLALHLSIGTLSAASYFEIIDGPSGKTLYRMKLLRSGDNQIIFNPALKLSVPYQEGVTPSGAKVVVASGAAGVINECTYNLIGWLE